MSVNVKALRALHETWKGYAAMHGNDVHPDYRRELADALAGPARARGGGARVGALPAPR